METVFTDIVESSAKQVPMFGVIFVISYLLYRRLNVSSSDVKLPPAMPSLPIVGSLPFMSTKLKDLLDFSISQKNKLGKNFFTTSGTDGSNYYIFG